MSNNKLEDRAAGTSRTRSKLYLLTDSVQASQLSRHTNPEPLGLGGYRASALVELTGIEPVTPCLQSRCSPS